MSSTRVERHRALVAPDIAETTQARVIGVGAVVGASVLFGTNAVFAKLSYNDGMAVFGLLWLRYLFPLIVLGPLAWAHRRRDPAPLGFRHALLVAIPYLGSSAMYLGALNLGPVNQIAPFFYLYPAILAVIGWAFFGESLARRMVFAIVLGVLGSALLVGFDGGSTQYLAAKLVALASATLAALFYVASSRLVPARQSVQSVAATCVLATIAFAPVVVLTHANLALPRALPYALVMAIGGSAIGLLLLQLGMRRLGATPASLLSLVEPVVTLSLAAVVLSEATQPLQLVGTLLVLCSFPLARVGKRATDPTPVGDII
jgi:drug/metabolite transporter (DMT)-like permease